MKALIFTILFFASNFDVATVSVNANAGTGASISRLDKISNVDDLTGIVTLTTGTGLSAGTWFTVTFDNQFTEAPVVICTPLDSDAADLQPDYWITSTTTDWSLVVSADVTTAEFESTEYQFQYYVVGAK